MHFGFSKDYEEFAENGYIEIARQLQQLLSKVRRNRNVK